MATKIQPLLDTCPMVQKQVDWRRCKTCTHYRGQERTGFAVTCAHADAKPSSEAEREERRFAFQTVGVAGAVWFAGPMREL
jgi:hypothetical protein